MVDVKSSTLAVNAQTGEDFQPAEFKGRKVLFSKFPLGMSGDFPEDKATDKKPDDG
jgi:hypothetical protein